MQVVKQARPVGLFAARPDVRVTPARGGVARSTSLLLWGSKVCDRVVADADWSGQAIEAATFENCTLLRVSFQGTGLSRLFFGRCFVDELDLRDAELADVVFLECFLGSVRLSGARLKRCFVQGCTFAEGTASALQAAGAVLVSSQPDL